MINSFRLAWLALTYRCNNKCVWCYAASNDSQASKEKILESSREGGIINLLSDLKVPRVTLIGGEPTLYKNLEEFVEKLTKRKIGVGIVTNGRKFKDRNFARVLKRNGLEYATFSIEGSNPESHDSTTQIKGSLEEALEGIENAQKEGIKTTTNTLISNKNILELEKILDMLKENGIKSMSYNICGVCISEDSNNKYLINPAEAIKAFERIYPYAKSRGIKVRLVTPMPICNFDKNLVEEFKKEKIISGGPCHVVSGRNFVIDYNGDIVPCTHLTGYPLFNIFKEKKVISREEFLEKYNSKESSDFRESIKRYPSIKCGGCKEKCSGGCPLYWIKLNPEEIIKGFV